MGQSWEAWRSTIAQTLGPVWVICLPRVSGGTLLARAHVLPVIVGRPGASQPSSLPADFFHTLIV